MRREQRDTETRRNEEQFDIPLVPFRKPYIFIRRVRTTITLHSTAEAEREAAKQKVLTVTMTSEAEREAAKKLVAAKQVIQEGKLREETSADVLAYMAVKEAEAERQAADLKYQARLKLADADAQGATKRAEGEQSVKMVDVNVERERVSIEQARVDVERQSLSNKQEFEGAALKFELEKLRIEAEREVRMAAAAAMGNMLAKAQMQIFGDPDTMARMAAQFMRAAGVGSAAEGLLKTLPPQGQDLLNQLTSAIVAQIGAAKAPDAAAVGIAGAAAADGNGNPRGEKVEAVAVAPRV